MSIEIISGEEVWSKERQSNPTKRWPSRKAGDRLYPVATPDTRASFKIHRHERIFCVGSCFARELALSLHRAGYSVLSVLPELPKSPQRKIPDAWMLNKFNVASIYNELRWALDPDSPYRHEDVLIETSGQRLQDYHLVGNAYTDAPDAARHFREAFNAAFGLVREADVVILTLGLSEVWLDKQTGLYLNVAVAPELVRRYPGRFELHVFDYAQTLAFLNDIHRLLTTHLRPGLRVLITVSPIPLLATFREQDVLVANTYSKSVLRAAVEEFVAGKENVTYFPSYEFVTLSNPQAVWREDDLRHVEPALIDYIMGNVMEKLTDEGESLRDATLRAKARALYNGHFLKDAAAVLRPLVNSPGVDRELLVLWAAVQLGMHGKLKSLLMKALDHFKTQRHQGFMRHIRDLARGYRKLAAKAFIGNLESWDGQLVVGWACDTRRRTPTRVNVLANGRLIATLPADRPRQDVAAIHGADCLHSGFQLALPADRFGSDPLHVVFAETGEDLPGSPIYSSRPG